MVYKNVLKTLGYYIILFDYKHSQMFFKLYA